MIGPFNVAWFLFSGSTYILFYANIHFISSSL